MANNGIPGYTMYFPPSQAAYLNVANSSTAAAIWVQYNVPQLPASGAATVFGVYPNDYSFRITWWTWGIGGSPPQGASRA